MPARTPPPSPLDRLQDPAIRAIAARGRLRSFPKNAIIISEGEQGDALYVILTGRVKVYSANAQGKEVVLDLHGPGEYVGEMALDAGPRSASVITLEPTTCAVVSRADLIGHMAENPEFALRLITDLIGRVRTATESVKSMALLDVFGRVVRLLTSLAVEEGGRLVIPERLTQQEIADRVGASRDMVTRIFKDLVAGGYISVAENRITLVRKPPPGW